MSGLRATSAAVPAVIEAPPLQIRASAHRRSFAQVKKPRRPPNPGVGCRVGTKSFQHSRTVQSRRQRIAAPGTMLNH